jgi:hypothetical protein
VQDSVPCSVWLLLESDCCAFMSVAVYPCVTCQNYDSVTEKRDLEDIPFVRGGRFRARAAKIFGNREVI